ncbi:hypothetical protein [Ignatzschineria cameli]|uniref:LamG-like jellyroll fold domain-containing protein n=1 Tax=Ignatzschineria cameli TaxID=2182793 RepID=A0A2U2AQ90_9GAMM|nr:hypothetical protein [Ignatzschineria cameli]PWD85792.1 hypothetical protein DC077_07090 [Ignatzschineria cameli]PWD89420.1 hypothetical protein DC079_06715 [Ignatzschineria cameli]PWD90892.1 hypothetical protein DC081_06425 [Ignatzschineria cameli]PWD91680.1 hypothetical protein DC078_06710 [Ignatzschineria cameli]
MGIVITSNVDASSYATKAFSSVQDGLQLMCFFDTSIQKVSNNFSLESEIELVKNGGIVVNKDGAVFNPVDAFLETELMEPDVFSVFVVGRLNNTTGDYENLSLFLGNENQSAGGISMGYQTISDPTALSFGRRYRNDVRETLWNLEYKGKDGHKVTDWGLYCAVFGDGYATLKCVTSGFETERFVVDGYKVVKNSESIKIGASGRVLQKGSSNISQVRFYDRALTQQEIDAVVDEMRKYEASHNDREV